MELRFLGTSAGEQYPGLWCTCANCEEARRLGGRNIRSNAFTYVAPNILIDLPPGTSNQMTRFGLRLPDMEHVLFTHSHEDHLDPFYLRWRERDASVPLPPPRTAIGPRFSEAKPLHVYCNEAIYRQLASPSWGFDDYAFRLVKLHLVQPFQRYEPGSFAFVPLRAHHGGGREVALNYIVEKEGKRLLYALDTGWPLSETYEAIRSCTYDLVVVEGTFGYGADVEEHMNLDKAERLRSLFLEDGLIKEETPFCVSHICPHHTPVHDEIAPLFARRGITIAYDGLVINV